ncbi:TetR/AcrR family transcriptional regulator [Agromyces subbeticus]|uniref:TetR/AcrR family transcriptional regulator n=1 Tax=Agromyces subbeticus TaxID=293890 RepID=UPI0003B78310|nr:TetR/AcrR family transcriptional regulator [Agromyces subbeticus]
MSQVPNSTRRSQKSTDAILRAALELAHSEGWPRVTIEGIAARAGVGKRTIYRWWPSKGAVVLDAYAQLLESSPLMRNEPTVTADIREDLVTMVRDTWIHAVGDSAPLIAALIGEAQHDTDLAARLWERLIVPSSERAIARIVRAQDGGEIDPGVDPYRATELLYGQIYIRLLLTPHDLDETFLESCVDLALNGLRAR